MNAHTRRTGPVPPWAVASLRAGLSLIDGDRIRHELCRAGIARQYRQMRWIAFGCPDVSPADYGTFRQVLLDCGVSLIPPGLSTGGAESRHAGAVAVGHYHAGFHMRAARALLGWSSGDASSLPDGGLSCGQLALMEASSRDTHIHALASIYSAAGVSIIGPTERSPGNVSFGVWAPVEILEPAAGRAALLRLRGDQHD
ncbi:hypothetical protein [Maricaulis salignorans]|uniref:hypothetical protein n=1 Tax=Maricaulis salignorans TaxID=144026 RepID=UPI003A8F395B